ncbi:MAG: cyclic nucleotide-binding domain-containing protein [Candidatus Firestonebacteria bacterium]
MSEEWKNRRKHKRLRLNIPMNVTIKNTNKVYVGNIVDISAGGVAISLDSFLPLGKNLLLSFKIHDDIVIEDVSTKILRVNDAEDKFVFGLEFLNMTQENIEKISNLANSIYFIKRIKLFSCLADDEALYLKSIGRKVNFKEDQVIFEEGSEGDAFYAVISGKIKITKKSQIEESNEEVLALIREGEFFGEMALFDEGKRTAGAMAHTDSSLFVITADDFNKMMISNHKLVIKILLGFIRTLSKRLKTMNQEMVDLLFSEASLSDYKK